MNTDSERVKHVVSGSLIVLLLAGFAIALMYFIMAFWSPVYNPSSTMPGKEAPPATLSGSNSIAGLGGGPKSNLKPPTDIPKTNTDKQTATPASDQSADGAYHTYGVGSFRTILSAVAHVLLLVFFAGALGGVLQTLISATVHLGTKNFDSAWNTYYLARPIEGAILACLSFLILKAGLIPNTSAGLEQAGPVALGALMGLFSRQAMEKLLSIFNVIFTSVPDEKKPDGDSSTPTLTLKVDPPTITVSKMVGVPSASTAIEGDFPPSFAGAVSLSAKGSLMGAISFSTPTLSAQANRATVNVDIAKLGGQTGAVTLCADKDGVHAEAVLILN